MRDLKLRSSKLFTVIALVAAFLLGSATYGAVELAGASGTNTVYYACLSSTGTLSHVGTTKPTTTICKTPSKVISWNSQGPTGPKGPAGPGPETYNWTVNVPAVSSTTSYVVGTTNLPRGSTVTVTSASLTGNFGTCVFGWSVAFYSSEGSTTPAFWSTGTNVTNVPPTSTSPETLSAQSPMLVVGQKCISSAGTPIPLPAFSVNITFTDTPGPTTYS